MPLHSYASKRRITPAVIDMSWDIDNLCKAYKWPSNMTGAGIIGIVELGGAYLNTDMEVFCARAGIPVPDVTHISINGIGQTSITDDSSVEVALDVQIAAAAYSIATGKPATIRVYWSDDIEPAVLQAYQDGCDVFSISWGQDEAEWDTAALWRLEDTIFEAGSAGMTVFAASGDNDSGDGGPNAANVDSPASCPHAIGCGGTELVRRSNGWPDTTETVWNDNPGQTNGSGTGGGYSIVFSPEVWQAGASAGPGRMVPDVSANASSITGYQIIVNGQIQVIGGTSAVAPLYAGLFASFGKKLGFIGPKLWKNHLAFNAVTSGDNGAFRAGPVPGPTCGLGSPNGEKLAALMAV